jgi:hypothetical protein
MLAKLILPIAIALAPLSVVASPIPQTLHSVELSKPEPTGEILCAQSTADAFETKNYFVSICGAGVPEDPYLFVLKEKKRRTLIIPIVVKKGDYSGDPFAVVSRGEFRYSIHNKDSSKNPVLIVRKGDRVIVREPVIRYFGGYFNLP